MIRAVLGAFLGSLALLCVLTLTATDASGTGCYDTYSYSWWGSPPGPGWTCELETDRGIFFAYWNCTRQNGNCPPAASQAETAPGPCPWCGGRPISMTSGNTYVIEKDVSVPGLSSGLSLVRTWNSMWPTTQSTFQTGLFGLSWRSNYEERVFFGADGFYKYSRGDGSFWSFGFNGTNWTLAAPANVAATLTWNSSTYTITFQNGESRSFDYTSGVLKSIVDRNGNSTQLSYDGLNRLVTVQDPGGRHLYFNYPNNTTYLISSVTSDVGLTFSYSYDTSGRLVQVTKPDATTTTYLYDSSSNLTTVEDSGGNVLESHTYDYCGRGLTSSRAGSVESITLTYPQPCYVPASYSVFEDHGLP